MTRATRASPEPDDAERRRRARGERAREHRAADDRRRAEESARAQVLVDAFVAEAVRRGLPTERLTARSWDGRHRYPTDVVGWYLRADRGVGVGADGGYYVLSVPPRRFGRWRTSTVESSSPPLVVGEGGRDGEAFDLDDLLRRRLDGS